VLALVLYSFSGGSLGMARDVTVAALLTVVGLAIVIGPWIYRLASDLSDERAERVRTQERADVAAHLHDSVLQTLALIQKNADDGTTVARLARAQERGLRAWLYAGESTDESTIASALRGAAARIEDEYAVSVDVVNVGDCDLDELLRPIVHATGEALTNAAKHAGAAEITVELERRKGAVRVEVADDGIGGAAAEHGGGLDGLGDRLAIVGGRIDVRSPRGAGTRVVVEVPLPPAAGSPEATG
jgi:signal transduction histidine kinase